MLDVVFIMLIFFIVTATFVKEIGLDVNSPDKIKNVKDADKRALLYRSRIETEFGSEEDIDFRSVRPILSVLRREPRGGRRQPHPDSTTER